MDETRIGVLLPEDAKCGYCGHTQAQHCFGLAPAAACGVMTYSEQCLCQKFEPEKPKKPGLWSKLGNYFGITVGEWFGARQ
jgi:hypothetical protein